MLNPVLTPLLAWALTTMTASASPAKLASQYQFPGHEETADAKEDRYRAIAEAALTVAFDPDERPLYAGAHRRAKTVITLLAIAYHESGYAHDVDIGPCYRGRDGKDGRCDGGASACMMQMKIGVGTTVEGWSQNDLFGDRVKCFRAGLHHLHRSFKACVRFGPDYTFAAYAGGLCEFGHAKSLELQALVRLFYAHSPPPEPDSAYDVHATLEPCPPAASAPLPSRTETTSAAPAEAVSSPRGYAVAKAPTWPLSPWRVTF